MVQKDCSEQIEQNGTYSENIPQPTLKEPVNAKQSHAYINFMPGLLLGSLLPN
jgi:hypothetical protein